MGICFNFCQFILNWSITMSCTDLVARPAYFSQTPPNISRSLRESKGELQPKRRFSAPLSKQSAASASSFGSSVHPAAHPQFFAEYVYPFYLDSVMVPYDKVYVCPSTYEPVTPLSLTKDQEIALRLAMLEICLRSISVLSSKAYWEEIQKKIREHAKNPPLEKCPISKERLGESLVTCYQNSDVIVFFIKDKEKIEFSIENPNYCLLVERSKDPNKPPYSFFNAYDREITQPEKESIIGTHGRPYQKPKLSKHWRRDLQTIFKEESSGQYKSLKNLIQDKLIQGKESIPFLNQMVTEIVHEVARIHRLRTVHGNVTPENIYLIVKSEKKPIRFTLGPSFSQKDKFSAKAIEYDYKSLAKVIYDIGFPENKDSKDPYQGLYDCCSTMDKIIAAIEILTKKPSAATPESTYKNRTIRQLAKGIEDRINSVDWEGPTVKSENFKYIDAIIIDLNVLYEEISTLGPCSSKVCEDLLNDINAILSALEKKKNDLIDLTKINGYLRMIRGALNPITQEK